jgi:tetratricopeptide (TPR) repeat protein
MTTLSYLLKGPVHNQSDVAGARGADKSGTDDTEWATSNAQVYLDTGKDLLQTGQYDLAIKQFLLAVNEAADEELPQARYYLAYAYSLNGDTRSALKYAADLEPDRSEDWAPDFIILKAKLLVDTCAFAPEVAWLTQAGNDLSGDMRRASIYAFLLGVGYRGIGDTVNEKTALSKVVAASAGSDLGTSATRLLQNP